MPLTCYFEKSVDCPKDSFFKVVLHDYECTQGVDCSLKPNECDTEQVLWQKWVKIKELIGCCSCEQVFVPLNRRVDTLVNSGLAGGGELSVDLALTLDIDNLPFSNIILDGDFLALSRDGTGVEYKVDFETFRKRVLDGNIFIDSLNVNSLCFANGNPLNNNAPDYILTLNNSDCVTKTNPAIYALSATNIFTAINSGLGGGGNLSADRSLVLDIDNLPAAAALQGTDVFAVSQAGVEAKTTLNTIENFLAIAFNFDNPVVDSLCFNPPAPVLDAAPAFLLGINGGSCVVKTPVPIVGVPSLVFKGISTLNNIPHSTQANHQFNFLANGIYSISLSWRVQQAESIDQLVSLKDGNAGELRNIMSFPAPLVGTEVALPISWIDSYNVGLQTFFSTLINYTNPADTGDHIVDVIIWQLA